MRRALLAACLLALALAPRAEALSLQTAGSFDAPIFVTSPPGDPRLFVVERAGRIQVLHDGVRTQFLDIHTLVDADGERGLLSMAFDPSYAGSGLFYVFFNDSGAAGAAVGDIHIDEFRVSANPNVANPFSRRRVMTLVRGTTASNHNGGQLQFGKDGRLYISVGDAANSANAQSLGSPHGKILRINPHGVGNGAHGVPSDNPFVGVSGAVPEIWSLGLRNPFRFSFDHLTGDIAIGDVGAGSQEEVDFRRVGQGLGRGANYGWPNCEGFLGSCPGSVPPVFAYGHSDPCNALIGGYVYRGSRAPEIAGRYLYTDNCHPGLRSLVLGTPLASGDRAESLTLPESPFSFGEDARCDLYVAAGSGTVARLVGSAAGAAPACSSAGPPAVAPSAGRTGQRAAALKRCKRKYRKARKRKRARHALTKPAKRRLKKKLRKCKRKARRVPV
jgi:glucose/arabinose dehydrogenase